MERGPRTSRNAQRELVASVDPHCAVTSRPHDETKEECDAVVVEDSENEADTRPDLEEFANHVLKVFPCALDGTQAGFDLLVEVLEHFGFSDLEQRSRAHSFLQAKRQEAHNAAFAAKLQKHLQQQDASQPSHVIIDSQAFSLSDEAEVFIVSEKSPVKRACISRPCDGVIHTADKSRKHFPCASAKYQGYG